MDWSQCISYTISSIHIMHGWYYLYLLMHSAVLFIPRFNPLHCPNYYIFVLYFKSQQKKKKIHLKFLKNDLIFFLLQNYYILLKIFNDFKPTIAPACHNQHLQYFVKCKSSVYGGGIKLCSDQRCEGSRRACLASSS